VCNRNRHKLPVCKIELDEVFIFRELDVAPLCMPFNMHAYHVLRVPRVLIQPFQKCVANLISSIWGCPSCILQQDFVPIIDNNKSMGANTIKCFDTRHDAIKGDTWVLFVGN